MTEESIVLCIDLFYISTALILIYPFVINRYYTKYRVLISLFVAQGVIQTFLAGLDPYVVYAVTFVMNAAFFTYVDLVRANVWGRYLVSASVAVWLAGITTMPGYRLMYTDQITPEQYLIYDNYVTIAIILLTALQTWLIIRATDGYRGIRQRVENIWLGISVNRSRVTRRDRKTRNHD